MYEILVSYYRNQLQENIEEQGGSLDFNELIDTCEKIVEDDYERNILPS